MVVVGESNDFGSLCLLGCFVWVGGGCFVCGKGVSLFVFVLGDVCVVKYFESRVGLNGRFSYYIRIFW